MKTASVLALVALYSSGCRASSAGRTAALASSSAADGATTVIQVAYPGAGHSLTLRGTEPLSWGTDTALTEVGPDLYEARFTGVPPTEVKPLLDGAWAIGANFKVVPGAVTPVIPRFRTHKGRVTRLYPSFHSQTLGNDRVVYAYLPPSYDENTAARYPVLYMQDGQNLFQADGGGFGGASWAVDAALDAAYGGEAPPREAIIIAPANAGAGRIAEYTPTPGRHQGGKADLYLKFLWRELKPRVDHDLRTLTSAAETGMMGSSLGALVSIYAATTEPARLGFLGLMSPSTWWDDTFILGKIPALAGAAARPARIYVDSGDGADADDADNTRQLRDALVGAGYADPRSLRYVVEPGAQHNEGSWARRFPAAIRFILGPR